MNSNLWSDEKEFPCELSKAGNNLSVDVLVYSKRDRVHTIGWFNFNLFAWHFLSNEKISNNFNWRYLDLETDKPIMKKVKEWEQKYLSRKQLKVVLSSKRNLYDKRRIRIC